jgi:hypothetical protein
MLCWLAATARERVRRLRFFTGVATIAMRATSGSLCICMSWPHNVRILSHINTHKRKLYGTAKEKNACVEKTRKHSFQKMYSAVLFFLTRADILHQALEKENHLKAMVLKNSHMLNIN